MIGSGVSVQLCPEQLESRASFGSSLAGSVCNSDKDVRYWTLYFGKRMTIVRNPKDELKSGTLHAMCKQLGIKKEEL